MNIEQFVTDYVTPESERERAALLTANQASLTDPAIADEAIEEMKARADHLQRADSARAQVAVDAMMQFANYTDDPLHLALAYFAKGNLEWVAFGRFADALELLEQASEIYEREQEELRLAKLGMSKIAVLANLGNYEEAIRVGEESQQVLLANGDPHKYAAVTMNMASVCEWQGDMHRMLALHEQADKILEPLQDSLYGQLLINKSIILRLNGRLREAESVTEKAHQIFIKTGYLGEAYRARQSLAVTYALGGRYNESLGILNEVQSFYESDARHRDVLRVGLYICETLLHIHQYSDTIQKANMLRELALRHELEREAALAANMEATAYIAIENYTQAEMSLAAAEAIFEKNGNKFATAHTQLSTALIAYHRAEYSTACSIAENSLLIFRTLNADYDALSADLLLARILLAQAKVDAAKQQIEQILLNAEKIKAPVFTYLAFELRGDLARLHSKSSAVLEGYRQSIEALEMLKGNLMVEHRVDFAAENQRVYEKAVDVALELGDFALALEYAERAKSRTLLELLAYQIDLSLEAKNENDTELIEELKRLQTERNRIYRELEGSDELRFTSTNPSVEEWERYQEILTYETKITELWQRLLVRNSDYAQDAALLWQWQNEPIHEHIDSGTLVVEYFVVNERLVLFLIDSEKVTARYLTASLSEIQQLQNFFDINCMSVVSNQHDKRLSAQLCEQSQAILHELYLQLLAPIEEEISAYEKLLFVPHYSLHHLPFHALHTGINYLIESHTIHYLPSVSLIRYCDPSTQQGHAESEFRTCTAFGYSNNNRLPHSVTEAKQIAALMDGTAYTEEQATTTALQTHAASSHVLHISTHGDFHAENPLFSGLTLADGPLTILDIFELRLQASLVVLSACQTGRNVVSNGDELRGLLRAFLYAGASSLVLTHWPIEDQSTAHFMNNFYSQLAQGEPKNSALRKAQLKFIHRETFDPPEEKRYQAQTNESDYSHPYWWASFFLVGHAGQL